MSDNKKADWELGSRKHALTLVELFTNVLVDEGVAHSDRSVNTISPRYAA